jgi:hypothetical protein
VRRELPKGFLASSHPQRIDLPFNLTPGLSATLKLYKDCRLSQNSAVVPK